MVREYKSAVTKRLNQSQNTPGKPLWQRNYYEHIIRDQESLERITEYITWNPENWLNDRFSVEMGLYDKSDRIKASAQNAYQR